MTSRRGAPWLPAARRCSWAGDCRGLASADFALPSAPCGGILAEMATNEPFDVIPDRDAVSDSDIPVIEADGTQRDDSVLDEPSLESVRQIALRSFPDGSSIEWSDDEDESGAPLKLMTVLSPAPVDVTHEAYMAFIRAWVQAEPPERRRRVRVSCRPGVLG